MVKYFSFALVIRIHNWESKSGLFLIYLIFTSSFCMVFLIYHCFFSMRTSLNMMRRLIMGSNSLLLPLFGLCHTSSAATRAQMDCSYVKRLSLFGLSTYKRSPYMSFGFRFFSVSFAPSGLRTPTSFRHSFQKMTKQNSNKNCKFQKINQHL